MGSAFEELTTLVADFYRAYNTAPVCEAKVKSFASQFSVGTDKVAAEWRTFMFSDAGEPALARYQLYFLEELCLLEGSMNADRAFPVGEFIRLVSSRLQWLYEQLLKLSGTNPHPAVAASPGYFYCAIEQQRPATVKALEMVMQLPADWLAAGIIAGYLKTFSGRYPERTTYRDIQYLKCLLSGLMQLFARYNEPSEAALDGLLEALNFNNLLYFNGRKKRIDNQLQTMPFIEREGWIRRETDRLSAMSEQALAFDPCWPSLRLLLIGSLKEQITLHTASVTASIAGANKLMLNVSVAQLALYLRLFVGERLVNSPNMSAIFRLVVQTVSSKRQQDISVQSLSKEFYSTDQVTAAKVKQRLQLMITQLNRQYFPILVGAGLVLHFFPGR